MANSMGIRTGRVDAMTFGLGSGIAGMAGVALSQIDNVSPNLGQAYIIDSFMVVVFGGVGNLLGHVAGRDHRSASPTSSSSPRPARSGEDPRPGRRHPVHSEKRPSGLFALKGRAAEG